MRYFIAMVTLLLATTAHAEVLIGVAGPMTGTYANFGTQMAQGVQAAADQLNALGGIEGELVEIISVDDSCDNRKAEIAAQSLVQRNVAVVIGHYCTYPSLTAAKIYDVAGIPLITPAASLPALTEAGLPNVIRLVARDDAQGSFAALRMKVDYAADNIAVISDGSAGSQTLLSRFNLAFAAAPGLSITINPETELADDLISDLAAKNTAALYCACTGVDAGRIAAQISAANLVIKIYGPDALLVPQFWENSNETAEGTFVSFALDPASSIDARKVVKSFKAADIAAESTTLLSYAALQLFAAAAERVGHKNGRAISSHLKSGASFSSVIGPLSFDAKGDVREPRLVWYVWSNGKVATEYSAK